MWKKKTIVKIWFSSLLLGCNPSSFLSSCLPSFSSECSDIWKIWFGTKKIVMDYTKSKVTSGSGIFKQTLPWYHGDQEVELTAILADLHLVVCPNLPGWAYGWPVTTVSRPNNAGISLGKKAQSSGFTEQTRWALPTLLAPTFHNRFLYHRFSLLSVAHP